MLRDRLCSLPECGTWAGWQMGWKVPLHLVCTFSPCPGAAEDALAEAILSCSWLSASFQQLGAAENNTQVAAEPWGNYFAQALSQLWLWHLQIPFGGLLNFTHGKIKQRGSEVDMDRISVPNSKAIRMAKILFILKYYSKKRNTRMHTFHISEFCLQGCFS